MTLLDALLVAAWIGVLTVGIAFAAWLHGRGTPTTYVRDLIHIGAGIWVFGWPLWTSPAPAIAIPALAFAAVLLAPRVARSSRTSERIISSLAGGDERWSGIVGYVLAFALFTAVAFAVDGSKFAAGAALLALAWGDGIGGLIGRRFGRAHYRLGWAKEKSMEGSSAVALCAALGAVAAGACLSSLPSPPTVVLIGATAAVVEAFSPRASDNVLVPLAVFVAATLVR